MAIPPSYSQSNMLEKVKDEIKITPEDLRHRRAVARENAIKNLILNIKQKIIQEADEVYPQLNDYADMGYDEVKAFTYTYSDFGYNEKKTGKSLKDYVSYVLDKTLLEINDERRYSVKLKRGETWYNNDKYRIESDIEFYWRY